MTDKKPYLIKAIYDWLADNDLTAQILIENPSGGWVSGVPKNFLEEAQLVLNISPTATRNLSIEKDYLYFDTRFSGQSCSVIVDMLAISGIFPREDHMEGMFFEIDPKVLEGKKETKSPENQGGFKFVK